MSDKPRPPSMDDKSIPSPPDYTQAEYDTMKEAGISPGWSSPPPFDGIGNAELSKPKPKQKEEEPRTVDLINMLNIATVKGLQQAAEKIRDRFHNEWIVQKERRDFAVTKAIQDHQPLLGDYWQEEYRARMRYENSIKVWEAFNE